MDTKKLISQDRHKRLNAQSAEISESIDVIKKLLNLVRIKTNDFYKYLHDHVEFENYRRIQNEINPELENITDALSIVKCQLKSLLGNVNLDPKIEDFDSIINNPINDDSTSTVAILDYTNISTKDNGNILDHNMCNKYSPNSFNNKIVINDESIYNSFNNQSKTNNFEMIRDNELIGENKDSGLRSFSDSNSIKDFSSKYTWSCSSSNIGSNNLLDSHDKIKLSQNNNLQNTVIVQENMFNDIGNGNKTFTDIGKSDNSIHTCAEYTDNFSKEYILNKLNYNNIDECQNISFSNDFKLKQQYKNELSLEQNNYLLLKEQLHINSVNSNLSNNINSSYSIKPSDSDITIKNDYKDDKLKDSCKEITSSYENLLESSKDENNSSEIRNNICSGNTINNENSLDKNKTSKSFPPILNDTVLTNDQSIGDSFNDHVKPENIELNNDIFLKKEHMVSDYYISQAKTKNTELYNAELLIEDKELISSNFSNPSNSVKEFNLNELFSNKEQINKNQRNCTNQLTLITNNISNNSIDKLSDKLVNDNTDIDSNCQDKIFNKNINTISETIDSFSDEYISICASSNYQNISAEKSFVELPRYVINQMNVKGYITILQTPWCFWFTPMEANEYLDDIPLIISSYYNRAKNIQKWKHKPSIGTLVCAKFQDTWYRATIISKRTTIKNNKKQWKYGIYYIDYGNYEELVLKYLRPLPNELLKYPIATFCCCLSNVISKSDDKLWTEDINIKFYDMVMRDNKVVELIIQPMYAESCPLVFARLKINNQENILDISDELVSQNYAQYGNFEEILLWYNNVFSSQMLLSSFSTKFNNFDEILLNKDLLNLYCPKFSSASSKCFNVTPVKGLNDADQFSELPPVKHNFKVNDEVIMMFAAKISSPTIFWMYLHSSLTEFTKFDEIMNQLNQYLLIHINNIKEENVKFNVCYAVKDKNEFHRCLILEKNFSNTKFLYQVECIDIGEVITVELDSIFQIPDYFVTSLPRLTINCCLFNHLNDVYDLDKNSLKYFKDFFYQNNLPIPLQCYFGINYLLNSILEPDFNNPLSLVIVNSENKILNTELMDIKNFKSSNENCNELINFDPKREDFDSIANSYAIDYDDPNVATLNYKTNDESKICFYYRVGKKCWKEKFCKFLHIAPGEIVPEKSLAYSIDSRRFLILPEPGSFLLIQISNIIAPNNFFGFMPYGKSIFSNITEWETAIDSPISVEAKQFINDFGKVYMKRSFCDRDLSYPAEGELLATKSIMNKSWCRSIVIDINETFVEVFHVDYGNREIIPMTDIRQMDKTFLHYDYRAVQCFLPIQSINHTEDSQWTSQARNCFESLVKSQILIIEVLDRFYVRLYTTDGLDIGKYMIDENYAQSTNIQNDDSKIFNNLICYPG